MNRCGHCGAIRETGDVCCVAQARNQGRIHATCNHDAPPGLTPELEAAYETARDAEQTRLAEAS